VSIDSELRRLAHEAATRVQSRAARQHREYLEVQRHLSELKTNLERDNLAQDRVSNFQVKIAASYQCPTCWVENKIRSPVQPIPGEGRRQVLECRLGHVFEMVD
jgi:hypothetical protein